MDGVPLEELCITFELPGERGGIPGAKCARACAGQELGPLLGGHCAGSLPSVALRRTEVAAAPVSMCSVARQHRQCTPSPQCPSNFLLSLRPPPPPVLLTPAGYPGYPLRPGGADAVVSTPEQLGEYIAAVVDATLGSGIAAQMGAFREGFNEVFSLRWVAVGSVMAFRFGLGRCHLDCS